MELSSESDLENANLARPIGQMHLESLNWFKNNDMMTIINDDDSYTLVITNYCKRDLFLYRYDIDDENDDDDDDELIEIPVHSCNDGVHELNTLQSNIVFSLHVSGCLPIFISHNNKNENNDAEIFMIYIPYSNEYNSHYITIYSHKHYTISKNEASIDEVLENQELSTKDIFDMEMECLFKYSFLLMTVFGIKIYCHLSFILFYIFIFCFWIIKSENLLYDLLLMIIQQFIVFEATIVHELGHAFGSYLFGGKTNRIMFWPFGGMTFNVVLNPITFNDGAKWNYSRLVQVVLGPLTHLFHLIVFGIILEIFFNENSIVVLPSHDRQNYEYVLLSYILLPNDMTNYNFIYNIFLISFNMHFWSLLINFLYPSYPFDSSKILFELIYKLNNKYKAIIYFNVNAIVIICFVVGMKLFFSQYIEIWISFAPMILWSCYQSILILVYFFQDKEEKHPLFKNTEIFHPELSH